MERHNEYEPPGDEGSIITERDKQERKVTRGIASTRAWGVLAGVVHYTVKQTNTSSQRQQLVLQYFPGVCALVHQIQFGDNSNSPQT